jgi:hypothetical protein
MRTMSNQRSRSRPDANRPSHQQRRVSQNDRSLDSRGPGERIRGTASQIAERYLTLARDTARREDEVAAEGYYQYAEHYIRVRNAGREDDQHGVSLQPTTPAVVEINAAGAGSSGDQATGPQLRWDAHDPSSSETGIR